MRKRKNGELPFGWRLYNGLGTMLLSLGLITLLLVSGGAMWQWIEAEGRVNVPPRPRYLPYLLTPTPAVRLGPIATATPGSDPGTLMPEGARLFVSKTDGD